MTQSTTLSVALDVHQDAIAVADVAQEPGAAVTALGTIGPRQGDLEQVIRQLHSQAPPRIFVDDAGPWGYGLSRYLTPKGHGCWVVAPSLMPQTAGDRVNTDRRDARQVARLMRSGALAPGSGPTGEAEARRDLRRARDETRSALKAATCRLNACLLRHEIRSTGRAPGARPPSEGARQWSVTPRPPNASSRKTSGRSPRPPNVVSALNRHCTTRSTPGVFILRRCPPGRARRAVHRGGPPGSSTR